MKTKTLGACAALACLLLCASPARATDPVKDTYIGPRPPSLHLVGVTPAAPQTKATITVNFTLNNDPQRAATPLTGTIRALTRDARNTVLARSAATKAVKNLAIGAEFSDSLDLPTPLVAGKFTVEVIYEEPQFALDPHTLKRVQRGSAEVASDSATFNATKLFVDADQDGLDDDLEHELLARYTPYLRFSIDNGSEDYRPMDVWTYVKWSELQSSSDEGNGILLHNVELAQNPLALLHYYGCDLLATDDIVHERKSRKDRYVNPQADIPTKGADAARHGYAWNDVMHLRNVGLYGHVVPFRATQPQTDFLQSPLSKTPSVNQRDWVLAAIDQGSTQPKTYYKIEYWQFFGYNDSQQTGDIGDHEADWTTVQLVVDPANGEVVQVHHFMHGYRAGYDLRQNPNFVELEGGLVREYRGTNSNRDVHFTWMSGPSADQDNSEAAMAAQNNRVRLMKDPFSGAYCHPVVYVERGGHEFWPTENWSMLSSPNHNGADTVHSYLCAAPPNLGEVEHALGEVQEAPLILRYNGHWGTYSHDNEPPQGPPLHDGWTWPSSSSIRWHLDKRLGN